MRDWLFLVVVGFAVGAFALALVALLWAGVRF